MHAILLHGLASDPASWDRASELLPADVDTWIPQLLMEGSIEDEADRIAAIARSEFNGSTLVGHSMGGLVATAVAERHPEVVDRLVLINAPHRVEARLAASGAKERILALPVIGPTVWRVMPASAVRNALTTAFAPNYQIPAEAISAVKSTPHHVYLNSNRAINDYISGKPLHRRLTNLSVPVTVLFGELDHRVDPTMAISDYSGIRDAEFVRIPQAGHSPQWETPEYVVAALGGGTALEELAALHDHDPDTTEEP